MMESFCLLVLVQKSRKPHNPVLAAELSARCRSEPLRHVFQHGTRVLLDCSCNAPAHTKNRNIAAMRPQAAFLVQRNHRSVHCLNSSLHRMISLQLPAILCGWHIWENRAIEAMSNVDVAQLQNLPVVTVDGVSHDVGSRY